MFLAMISTPTLLAAVLVTALVGFTWWKVGQVHGNVRSGERAREMALLATLPGAAGLIAASETAPSVDDLTLSAGAAAAEAPDAVTGSAAGAGPSETVEAAAAALMRASVLVTRAGASGDAAAAAVAHETFVSGPVADLLAVHTTKA